MPPKVGTVEEGGERERRSGTKRELLSLIGQLQHACCVVRPGRTFLRQIIPCGQKDALHNPFEQELSLTATFLPSWNDLGMMSGVVRTPPAATIMHGCIRVMRVWGFLIRGRMVSVRVAGAMA